MIEINIKTTDDATQISFPGAEEFISRCLMIIFGKQMTQSVGEPTTPAAPARSATTEPPVAPVQTTVAPQAQPPTEPEEIKLEDIRAAALQYTKLPGVGRTDVVKTFAEFGLAKISDTKPEQYAAVHARLTELIGGAK